MAGGFEPESGVSAAGEQGLLEPRAAVRVAHSVPFVTSKPIGDPLFVRFGNEAVITEHLEGGNKACVVGR